MKYSMVFIEFSYIIVKFINNKIINNIKELDSLDIIANFKYTPTYKFTFKESVMRAYFFGNMYLSSIQQGIQAAHVTHELFTKYTHTISGKKTLMLYDWAKNHKTMILLNGGYLERIQQAAEFFDYTDNPYPWVAFHEGEDSLGGIITSVGIVLPEKIYLTAGAIRERRVIYAGGPSIDETIKQHGAYTVNPKYNTLGFDITDSLRVTVSVWEYDLISFINKCGLAS